MSTTTFVTWFSVVSAAQAAPVPPPMTAGEDMITWVGLGLFVTLLVTGAIGFCAYKGWIQGAAVKRVVGFVFFTSLSHSVMLRAAPDIASAMVGIFLVTTICAVVMYLTWERTWLETMVVVNGSILLVAGFYGTLLYAAYNSQHGQEARAGLVQVRKALAKPIDAYLQKAAPPAAP